MASENRNINSQNSALNLWKQKKKKISAGGKILKKPGDEPPIVSYGQERLWVQEQLYPNRNLYNYAHFYHLTDKINLNLLEESFRIVISRHDVLRTNYQSEEGKILQLVNPSFTLPVSHISIENQSGLDMEKRIAEETRKIVQVPFDLTNEPLIRLNFLHLDKGRIKMILIMHHILGDAWSLNIIHEEVSSCYQSLSQGKDHQLKALKFQYEDFAYWQRKNEIKESDLDYWKKKLSNLDPALNLPTTSRKNIDPVKGRISHHPLSPEISKKLKSLASSLDATLFSTMLTIYNILLSRYTGQKDIAVGSPFSNRDNPDLEKLIGFFNETLILRTPLDGLKSFQQMVEETTNTVQEAIQHRNITIERLVTALKIPRTQGHRNPLFQTMFLYNASERKLTLGDEVSIESEMLDLEVSKFDLTLFVNDLGSHLELAFEYSDKLDSTLIASMGKHFEVLANNIINGPQEPISQLPLLSTEELATVANQLVDNKVEFPDVNNVHELITNHARKIPDALAAVHGNESLTYEELDRWSDEVASKILEVGDFAIEGNQFIGLHIERSLEMVVGILAILKSGNAYLPLDPEYPLERIDFMLSDAKAKLVLTKDKGDLFDNKQTCKIIEINQPSSWSGDKGLSNQRGKKDDFAYLIYTSGSTGTPKGVPVTHRNLLHSTSARFHFYEDEMKSFLLLSSFSFDSSIAGIFWSLCSGGKLVLPPKRIEQDIQQLSEIIESNEVSHTLLLPSLYQVLLEYTDPECLRSLKAVVVAGEACYPSLLNLHFQRLPKTRLYNEYGPTEASVWCIAHEITEKDLDLNIPIGLPISNASAYILDEYLNPVPKGVTGELYIGGSGLVKSYLNRPELTEERFIPNPIVPNEKIYKTGDIARYANDGNIQFLGRADSQVKIRGHRVELGEIREALLLQESVSEAEVVVTEENGANKRVFAYITGPSAATEEKLLALLKKLLPDYMVPSAIIVLPEMPKLPNGKVDRNRLMLPEKVERNSIQYIAPSTSIEKELAKIWEEVLAVHKVGIQDNFFDIGGDSILSIQIVSKARKANLLIGPSQIFDYPSIELLAEQVKIIKGNGKTARSKNTSQSYPIQLPLSYQQEAFLFHSIQRESDQGFLQLTFKITGKIDPDIFKKSWSEVIDQHPIMRTSFHWDHEAPSYQEIQEEATLSFDYVDLSGESTDERLGLIELFQKKDKEKGIDLTKAPISRVTLICLPQANYEVIWTCHHVLVDGWSATIIFKDVLRAYASLLEGQLPEIEAVPNHGNYLEWKSQQDLLPAEKFWSSMLNGATPTHLSELSGKSTNQKGLFEDLRLTLSQSEASEIQNWAKRERLTLNTLLQGLWMISLANFLEREDIVIGLTVSGRSVDFEGIERLTGLYMNVLPIRKQINNEASLKAWLFELQQTLSQIRSFEYINADKIREWTHLDHQGELFDSLFVFGNFLNERLSVGELTVEKFDGEFSSVYPLTVRVNPSDVIDINFRYNKEVISIESIKWLSDKYVDLVRDIPNRENENDIYLSELISDEAPILKQTTQSTEESTKGKTRTGYKEPTNNIQLDLVKIWENILGTSTIGIKDNFFDLGGTSLNAIQLFNQIEKHFSKKISPTSLISSPTIQQLSGLISTDQELGSTEWSSIVPLKTTGDLTPLFCIHSGGAHVLFYQGLAKHMSPEQPIYAIQPAGIDGKASYHDTIENMARHYIDVIKSIQPAGPYKLLGTCFSNAVGLEMAHQLKIAGDNIDTLYIVDSAPAHMVPPSPNGEKKPISRMLQMASKGNWKGIAKKLSNRKNRLKDKISKTVKTETEKDLEKLIDSLNKVYDAYHWKPLNEKVVLLRSSEFSNRKDKEFHLEQWNELALKGVEVLEVQGHHLTLFEEPEVQGLAAALGDHILDKPT